MNYKDLRQVITKDLVSRTKILNNMIDLCSRQAMIEENKGNIGS